MNRPKPKNLFIFFIYNRPKILQACLESFFANDFPKDSYIIFIDDAASSECKNIYLPYIQGAGENALWKKYPMSELVLHWDNRGYSYSFFEALNLCILLNPENVFFVETDYVFTKGFYENCVKVLDSSKAIAINGFSHPDLYNRDKCIKYYGQSVTEQHGEDVPNRSNLYKPFDIENIKVQYGTHSCCTLFLQWSKLISKVDIEDLYRLFDRVTERKTGFNPITPNDGLLTGGISLLWAKANNFTSETQESAFIDIIDPPIAAHIHGGGINGGYLPEGATDCLPPNWKKV
jgi:GT2 family glycosyltransferase